MDKYIFEIDKSLIDLGAIAINSSNMDIIFENCAEGNIKLFNGSEEKLFKLNRDEKLIQGRGIKSFFKKFNGNHLIFEKSENGYFEISNLNNITDKYFEKNNISIKNKEHAISVLDSLSSINQSEEKWFQLYNLAGEFNVYVDNDELISLPLMRDINFFEYQLKTVKAVIKKFKGRVLLSDEVGLGKTIEAGMAMMEYVTRGLAKKILILVPPSLVEQWDTEIKRKFNLDFIKSDDADFKNMGSDAWKHYNKVIASIATAKRKNNSDIISKINYDLIIVDEAHHLKNRNSAAWKFVNSLQKKYIFLLTATPVQNNLEELYNLITLLKPGQLKTYAYFKKTFIGDSEGLEAKNVDSLRALLADVMIRNKRSDVDIKFTKRFAVTYNLSLNEEELLLYNNISRFIRKKYLKGSNILTKFMLKNLQEEMGSGIQAAIGTLYKYSQNEELEYEDREALLGFYNRAEILLNGSNHNAKIEQLHKIIDKFNDKIIVFTKYKTTLEYIVKYLNDIGIDTAKFHGGLKRKEKEAQIEFFKDKARVLVSTEAGGEGRNLQFCNAIVNYDLPWNPMAIEQRIGRIHRVLQKRDVYLFNLAAKDTVEYYILDLLDRKINMFELVVGEVDMILGDIEDKEDFSDIIMDAWVNSEDSSKMENMMEDISQKLIENKNQYIKIKNLDNKLFDE